MTDNELGKMICNIKSQHEINIEKKGTCTNQGEKIGGSNRFKKQLKDVNKELTEMKINKSLLVAVLLKS